MRTVWESIWLQARSAQGTTSKRMHSAVEVVAYVAVEKPCAFTVRHHIRDRNRQQIAFVDTER